MEKFVLSFVIGDGCTYSCEVDMPIEYESLVDLYFDINARIKEAFDKKEWDFEFAGKKFDLDWFLNEGKLPEEPVFQHNILTLDEWFYQGAK